MRSDIFQKRIEPKKYFWLFKWLAYFLIGFFTGIVAFLMTFLEDFLVGTRNSWIESILDVRYGTFAAWSFLMAWCIIIAGTASFITINIGPGALGSGVPELMSYLNGVNYPKLISF
jgi:H+/Cl- antiporter ClcA